MAPHQRLWIEDVATASLLQLHRALHQIVDVGMRQGHHRGRPHVAERAHDADAEAKVALSEAYSASHVHEVPGILPSRPRTRGNLAATAQQSDPMKTVGKP